MRKKIENLQREEEKKVISISSKPIVLIPHNMQKKNYFVFLIFTRFEKNITNWLISRSFCPNKQKTLPTQCKTETFSISENPISPKNFRGLVTEVFR